MQKYNIWLEQLFLSIAIDGLWPIKQDTAHFLFDFIIRKKPRNVLEFGSGVSTVIMAKAVSEYGGRLYSLEHQLKWVEKTAKMCAANELKNNTIIYAPLVEDCFRGVAPYKIYDPQKIPTIKFDFVFIDGPPGYPQGAPGRRGTLYSSWRNLQEHAIILLDDGEREDEQNAVLEWMSVLGEKLTVRYLRLQRPAFLMEVREWEDGDFR